MAKTVPNFEEFALRNYRMHLDDEIRRRELALYCAPDSVPKEKIARELEQLRERRGDMG